MYLGNVVGTNVGLLNKDNMDEEKSVDFESIPMRSNSIKYRTLIIILSLRSPRKRVHIGEQYTEIGPKALDEIELTGRRETREALNEREHAIEQILLFYAEDLFVGEVEGDACLDGNKMRGKIREFEGIWGIGGG